MIIKLFSKIIYTNHHRFIITRFKYCKSIYNYIINSNNNNKVTEMSSSSIQELEQERQKLVDRVNELVDKLESKKLPNEIKVPKDAIVRPREEQEASVAMEKLEIDDEESKLKQAEGDPAPAQKKPQQQKGARKQKAGAKEPPAPEKPIDASRLDLRIGRIVDVNRHPDADSLYVEKIDVGDPSGEPRTIISGLVKHVPIEEMKDRIVLVLCNLKPAKMRGILSEGMVMCASSEDHVEILQPPAGVKPGDRVVFDNYPGEPDEQLNPKKKIWELVAPDLKTNEDGVAMYKECKFKLPGVEGEFRSNLKNVQVR